MFLRMSSALFAKGLSINLESALTLTREALSIIFTVKQQSLESHENPLTCEAGIGADWESGSETRRPSGAAGKRLVGHPNMMDKDNL